MIVLKDIPLFSDLSDKYVEELQNHIQVRNYTKDSIVFYEGDESEYLHILIEGRVRIYKTTPKGRQIHMHNFSAPDIIALYAAFENVPFPATCEFLTEGSVGLLPVKKFYTCLHNLNFSLSMITALTKRIKLLAELLHKETVYSSEAKIANLIYTDPTIFERLKNNEIASILNITPETLSRILSKLKKEKIIEINEHVVMVFDKNRLKHIISTNQLD
ncbi:MAG TPA: Crp/Fnr family transcriptional regulator [Sulfurovum sp.]|nr:MAG: Crp/Fnr family transcriptional regulator [Sulfurovum sp. 16-42-52]OZA43458.1 MAG: Crp/Fnr family transcriptional regulator [Sulfurovum sp. 17-42-90]HQS72240.1 Crp/Fnr family transcriptional regulator [Sulfurovum sp.]